MKENFGYNCSVIYPPIISYKRFPDLEKEDLVIGIGKYVEPKHWDEFIQIAKKVRRINNKIKFKIIGGLNYVRSSLKYFEYLKSIASDDVELLTDITEEEKWKYVAYKGLRDLGHKPYLNNDNIFLNRKRVNVRYYKDIINLSELTVGYFAVVDSDYEPIFYQIKRRNPLLLEIVRKTYSEIGQSKNKHNKLVVKSGSKFGCDYSNYRNNELHSSLLVNIAKEDDCKSIVARARIAHSVRKILIYCFEHGGKNKCISIEWIR